MTELTPDQITEEVEAFMRANDWDLDEPDDVLDAIELIDSFRYHAERT